MKIKLFILFVFLSYQPLSSQWTELSSGISDGNFAWFAADNKYSNRIFAASDNLLLFSSDFGSNWSIIASFNNNIFEISANDSVMFCNVSGDLVKSTDFGKTWSKISLKAKLINGTKSLDSLKINDNFNSIYYINNDMYLTSNGVFRSSDGGLTWTGLIPLDPPYNNNLLYYGHVQSIVFIGNRICFDCSRGVLCSDDDGLTWKRYNKGLVDSFASSKKLFKYDNKLFLITGYRMVYVWSDSTEMWSLIYEGTDDNSHIPCGNGIWYGNNSYMNYTSDSYNSQKKYNLSSYGTGSLFPVLLSGDYLYIHVNKDNDMGGYCVVRGKLNNCELIETEVEDNQIFTEFSISPNPASEFIEIFQPSESSKLSEGSQIKIYNVFGQEVNLTPSLSMLGEGENNPLNPPFLRGNLGSSSSQYSLLTTQYSAKIDVSPLSPGVYFVRVGGRVGKFVKI